MQTTIAETPGPGVTGGRPAALRRARSAADARTEQTAKRDVEFERRFAEVSAGLRASNHSLGDALAAAEDMASHAMRLQELTAALSQAHSENEVADIVLGRGVGVVESVRGVLARVEGSRFELIRASGYPPELEARLLGMTIDDVGPLTHVVKSGEPLWLGSRDEHLDRFPQLYERLGITPPQASVAVPLRHGGEIVGALGLFFGKASAFGAVKQAFTLLLAQAAGDALARARSYDAERGARRDAETLAQARADVLGVVAHDLRNPLNAIAASASALLEIDELSPAQRRKMLEITQRAVRRMNRMIGDLLDATRLQAGRLSLDLTEVDARSVIAEAEETLASSAAERRVVLRSHVPGDACWVRADEGRLLQVVGNLVANAVKFSAAGGCVTLSTRSAALEVIFSVSDDGPGIPPEHQVDLFNSFWQARTGDRRGVGLGLSITKGIVEAHGGRIWVESTVGVGSTFAFALPMTTTAAAR
jgi:signal transduction histidine kinase